MTAISITGLSKIYRDKKRRRITALDGLDLQVERGEVFGFLGPNGAGKSTTIKALVGQMLPTSGSACLFGLSATKPEARRHVGYLPENPSFYDFLTAREYLTLVGRIFNMDKADIVVQSDRVLEQLDLRSAERRQIRSYSKGMVQRLGLAQTMLHDPDLYILDEPMSGLDPLGRALVKEIMVDLKKRGKTVFFSTHVTADVEAVCDRVAVIVGGKLQTVNVVSDLLDAGIMGYLVQVVDCPEKITKAFDVNGRCKDISEVFVPANDLNSFMAIMSGENCSIKLIEPKRHDLEQFFLDIVKRG